MKGKRKDKDYVKDLVKKLSILRTELIDIIEKFKLDTESQIIGIINILEGKSLTGEAPLLPPDEQLKILLEKINCLKIKPQKGRTKDLVRIKKLVKEFASYMKE